MPKCAICKNKFIAKYFNQKSCLEVECILAYLKIYSDIKAKKEAKEKYIKIKTQATQWDNKLQTKTQEIARLIDNGMPCLARNTINCQMHGGHVHAKGGSHQCRYNLHNIHRQSAQSNKWFNDSDLLRQGITNEYGSNYLEFIDSLKLTPKRKFTQVELMEIYDIACKVATRLRKANLQYSLSERIELRNNINLELGIYDTEYCIFSL